MKPIFLACLFGLFSSALMGQYRSDSMGPNRNALSIELMGGTICYSIKYERIFYRKGKNLFLSKVGFGYLPLVLPSWYSSDLYTANLEVGLLHQFRKQHLEFGIGFNYMYLFPIIFSTGFTIESTDLKILFARLGYRYCLKNQKLYFLAALTPMILLDKNEPGDEYSGPYFVPFGGIGAGFYLR